MVRRTVGSVLLLGAMLAGSACADVEFLAIPAEEVVARPHQVGGRIQLVEEDSFRVDVDVGVRRGIDANGRPLPLADPTVLLLDTLLLPRQEVEGRYAFEGTFNVTVASTLADPSFAVLPLFADPIPLPRVERAGPWVSELPVGTDLTLGIEGGERYSEPPATWRLRVGEGCEGSRVLVSIEAPGLPPDSLGVSWDLVESEPGTVLSACLQVRGHAALDGPDEELLVTVLSTVGWRIHVVEPG